MTILMLRLFAARIPIVWNGSEDPAVGDTEIVFGSVLNPTTGGLTAGKTIMAGINFCQPAGSEFLEK